MWFFVDALLYFVALTHIYTFYKQSIILYQEEKISELNETLQRIQAHINGDDVGARARQLAAEIKMCEDQRSKLMEDHDELVKKQDRQKADIDNWQAERTRLTLQDKDNRRIQICLAYANRIYEDLNDTYTQKEKEIRDRLENTINELFVELYDGGLSLKINPSYRIKVYDQDYESGVETSDGQNISVIFAFISAIIKLAKENAEKDEQFLSSETYPLVMDAPLSLFDKTRIDNVCRMLPNIAEQVIIFIKDTDGDLAKEKMKEKIGSSYIFDKHSKFDTRINPTLIGGNK